MYFKCIYWLLIYVINIVIISTWKWHWRPCSCEVEEMAWNFGTPWTKPSCFNRSYRFFGSIRCVSPVPHLITRPPLMIPNTSYMQYNQHHHRDSWHPQVGPQIRTGLAQPDFAPCQPTHDVSRIITTRTGLIVIIISLPRYLLGKKQYTGTDHQPPDIRWTHTSDDPTSNRGRRPETYRIYSYISPEAYKRKSTYFGNFLKLIAVRL